MTTFFMFGKYSVEAIRQMSIARTQQVVSEIKKLGVALPGVEDAIKASVNLNSLTGISFTTCPAVTVETFDQLLSD